MVGKKLDILEFAILNKSSQESHTSPVSRTQTYATSSQVVVRKIELKESIAQNSNKASQCLRKRAGMFR